MPCRQARLPLLCRLFVPPTHVDARRTRNLRGAAALRSPQRKGAHWLVRPGDKQRQHASERHTLPQVGDRSLVRPPLEPGARCWDGSPLLVSVARGVSTTLERRKAQDDEARDSEFGSGDMEHSVRTLLAAPRRRRWFTPGDVYVPEVPAKP